MKEKLIYEIKDTDRLLRAVPSSAVVFFCLSVVLMNLFANKEVNLGVSWLAIDCGIMLSWLSFLSMDVITKRFGPKAAIKVSLFAVVVNLCVCGVFKLVALVPGNWGEFYTFDNILVNQALNNTFGGTWYVLFGSTVAIIVSSIINAVLNHTIGKRMSSDNFRAFAIRSYVSTFIAQFFDNMVFALIVSYNFFGWSLTQCVAGSIIGCTAELLCEVVFSPIGYKISQRWEKENVGAEYLEEKV